MINPIKPFSAVYQITQNCPFDCQICLRRYEKKEKPMGSEDRRKMVKILKDLGLKRLTITGGEPMILGEEVLDFLRYIHELRIHTCLSTTGYGIDHRILFNLDEILDQILISVRALDKSKWEREFGEIQLASPLYEEVKELLTSVKSTNLIVEVNTVVHKQNIDEIINLGRQLFEINPSIIWRLDEYYAIGLRSNLMKKFELEDKSFELLKEEVTRIFARSFRDLRFTSRIQRESSSEYMITHKGDLITTSDHLHRFTGINVFDNSLPTHFDNLRTWEELQLVCRDWGW